MVLYVDVFGSFVVDMFFNNTKFPWLLFKIIVVSFCGKLNSCNNIFNHNSFLVAKEVAMYSTSSDENVTIGFFFICPTHGSIFLTKRQT